MHDVEVGNQVCDRLYHLGLWKRTCCCIHNNAIAKWCISQNIPHCYSMHDSHTGEASRLESGRTCYCLNLEEGQEQNFPVHRRGNFSIAWLTVLIDWLRLTYIMDNNLLCSKSIDSNINLCKNIFTETSRIMLDQISGSCDSAKLVHNTEHPRVPSLSVREQGTLITVFWSENAKTWCKNKTVF